MSVANTTFNVNDLFTVKKKIIVVTGGGSGIGKAIAEGFAANGAAKVYIVGRRKDVLETAAKELSLKTGGSVIAIPGDVGTKLGCQQIVDTLVNNAGVNQTWRYQAKDHNDVEQVCKMLTSVEDEDIDYTQRINSNGIFFMTTALLPLLRGSDDPNVTVIASTSGLINTRTGSNLAYSVSKAAAIHCAKHLAVRFHPLKIRVNTICPGLFPTEMTCVPDPDHEGRTKLDPDCVPFTKRITAGREGRMEEIVGPCLMLSSPAGGYMNGSVFTVDGGEVMAGDVNEGIKLPDELYSA